MTPAPVPGEITASVLLEAELDCVRMFQVRSTVCCCFFNLFKMTQDDKSKRVEETSTEVKQTLKQELEVERGR